MMRTLIYYLILINLLLSSISLSEEVDIFSLDPIDVCVALERDDCDNASPESFMHQTTKFIDVKDKTCLFVSVSKDIKTNKLTTTSYTFWNKRDQWGDNQFCSKNKGMSLGINRFGESAPYKKVYEHLDLSVEKIVLSIQERLRKKIQI